MNDTLLGVLLGGLIGWIAPFMTLRYGEKRWKFEAKLAYLKTERDRFEVLYERTIQTLTDGVDQRVFSSNMLADILVLMPEEVCDKFNEYAKPGDIEDFERKRRYLELVAAMKRDLKARDARISTLLQG